MVDDDTFYDDDQLMQVEDRDGREEKAEEDTTDSENKYVKMDSDNNTEDKENE